MKASFHQACACAANSASTGFVLPSTVPAPLFSLGQRVSWTHTYKTFTHHVVGEICGFEYIDHPQLGSGWSYLLSVESSTVTRPDNTVRVLTSSFETAPEQEIALTSHPCLTLVELAG